VVTKENSGIKGSGMEFYIDLFRPLFPHFQEYSYYYIFGVPVLLLLIHITRWYSVPTILYVLEYTLYAGIMHTVVHVLVRLFCWFKNNSSMNALQADGTRADPEAWTTPWKQFWNWEYYDPEWIPWMELFFLIVVAGLMIRFRPFRPTKRRRRAYVPPPPPKPNAADDNWGVPKQYHVPAASSAAHKKKK